MKKVGFIGAGKVACTMGKYLSEKGVPVTGYYDKEGRSADEAATFTETNAFADEKEVIAESDVIFIATPDDIISSVWEKIKTMDIRDKIIGIFSGSLSSMLFHGIETCGAAGVSIHPMYAFSDRFSDYQKLHTTMFTMEGDQSAVDYMRGLFEGLGHKVFVIDQEKKVRYHAAASVASNLMVGLYDMSLSMLKDCGFSAEDATELITPLVSKNTSAMLSLGPCDALTGPVERGDAMTVKHHIEVMTPEEKEIYIPLAKRLLDIAAIKNPDRDYKPVRRILMDSDPTGKRG